MEPRRVLKVPSFRGRKLAGGVTFTPPAYALPAAAAGALGGVLLAADVGAPTAQTQTVYATTIVSPTSTAATNITPFGFTTAAQSDAIRLATQAATTDINGINAKLALIKQDVDSLINWSTSLRTKIRNSGAMA